MEKGVSIATNYNNNNSLKLVTSSGKIEELIEYCRPIADSGISPFKDPAQVAAIALWSLDKDINIIDALSHTFILNGKIALDSHMVRGLLQKNGITHKYLRYYENVYQYMFKDMIFEQNEIDKNKESFKIFYTIEALQEWRKLKIDLHLQPVLRSPNPIDIVTTIEFTRVSAKGIVHTLTSSFSIKEAEQAGLLSKSNWVNYPKLCLAARAYVIGAREIADDVIFGMYSPEELGYEGITKIDEVVEAIEYQEMS